MTDAYARSLLQCAVTSPRSAERVLRRYDVGGQINGADVVLAGYEHFTRLLQEYQLGSGGGGGGIMRRSSALDFATRSRADPIRLLGLKTGMKWGIAWRVQIRSRHTSSCSANANSNTYGRASRVGKGTSKLKV